MKQSLVLHCVKYLTGSTISRSSSSSSSSSSIGSNSSSSSSTGGTLRHSLNRRRSHSNSNRVPTSSIGSSSNSSSSIRIILFQCVLIAKVVEVLRCVNAW